MNIGPSSHGLPHESCFPLHPPNVDFQPQLYHRFTCSEIYLSLLELQDVTIHVFLVVGCELFFSTTNCLLNTVFSFPVNSAREKPTFPFYREGHWWPEGINGLVRLQG
ncbi:hypothetical protein H1C71_027047 [Ictidomys tridecemlineatus]|nr:hypothetical protein H1C71_027047 [Ictidomys tridecemlineatus]KAG3290566.1 hypothetical protein H1C71_027047 [Ictidomys tridecemlineatus]KAG3290567.1 hypothetical protein H1C71_027047 [Ictidomys tridecemlineatus]KAG3290568.1 hypothetical protein H1C71_027047 [Ictidomys tridecemlineatus]KAG3290569.1 hypothetical protein H1C71_027047 [Ictidomys tridecemlineatus]